MNNTQRNDDVFASIACHLWMTSQLHTVKPLDSVAHARALLEQHRINQLPVVEHGILVGIVTDRDLRTAVNATPAPERMTTVTEALDQMAPTTPVKAVMTCNVITLAPHSSLITAAQLMRSQRIGSVPIVDGEKLVGIITRSDILKAFIAHEAAGLVHIKIATKPDFGELLCGKNQHQCIQTIRRAAS